MKHLFLSMILVGLTNANLARADYEQDSKDCPELAYSTENSPQLSILVFNQIAQALQVHRNFSAKQDQVRFRTEFDLQNSESAPISFHSFSGDNTMGGEIVYSVSLMQTGNIFADRFNALLSCDHKAKVARLMRVDIVRSSVELNSSLARQPIQYNIGVRYDANGKMHFSHASFGR